MIAAPIIVIDDDQEDIELIEQALSEIEMDNEIITFNDAEKAYAFLATVNQKPLFILCDINMSKLDGLELRTALQCNGVLRIKTTPFLFLSTSSASPNIQRAYELCVQGYFVKPDTYSQLVVLLKAIVTYWGLGMHPAYGQ